MVKKISINDGPNAKKKLWESPTLQELNFGYKHRYLSLKDVRGCCFPLPSLGDRVKSQKTSENQEFILIFLLTLYKSASDPTYLKRGGADSAPLSSRPAVP